jgi:hypothetical protein
VCKHLGLTLMHKARLMIVIVAFCLAIVGVLIAIAVAQVCGHTKAEERVKAKYRPQDLYVSWGSKSFIGINFDEGRVCLGRDRYESSYGFDQIAAVEIIRNGSSITRTNRGSQVLSAVVGGLALGPLGAVLGGLSGSTTSTGKIVSLELKIIVDDRTNPVYTVSIYESHDGKGKSQFLAKSDLDIANRFHAHILNAMRRVEELKPRTITPANSAPTVPLLANPKNEALPEPTTGNDDVIATQLRKFWEMKQAGILTEEEFFQQKARLLGLLNSTPTDLSSLTSA